MPTSKKLNELIINKNISKEQFQDAVAAGTITDDQLSIVDEGTEGYVEKTGDTMTGDLNVPNVNFTNKGKLTYQVGTSKINLISADDSNTLGKINVGQGNVQTNVNSATFTQTLAGVQYKVLNNNDTVSPVTDENKVLTQADITQTGAQWGNIGGTLSDQTDLNSALSAKADDSSVVHKSAMETITGRKTISGANANYLFRLQNTSDTKATTPSANMDTVISFTDANDANMARLMARHNTNGTTQFSIIPECSLSTADFQTWFSFVNTGTRGYIVAPSVNPASNSTTSTEVPTIGWVNNPSLSTNVVHRTGNETISGAKRFTTIGMWQLDAIKGTAPASDTARTLYFMDNSGESSEIHAFGAVRGWYRTDKTARTDLMTFKSVNATDLAAARISIGYDSNNELITYSPASDRIESIVTTLGISKNPDGYVKLGNGIIIQWGTISAQNANSTGTVTLPTAFTSTNYVVQIWHNAISNGYIVRPTTKTTTTFAYATDIWATGYNPSCTKSWLAIGY